MIKPEHIEQLIFDTLLELQLQTDSKIKCSSESVDILLMTAAHESHLGYFLMQEKGPAVGIFQMEPATYKDHWNYIKARKWLYSAMLNMGYNEDTSSSQMRWDNRLAILMSRIHYYRKPEALPVKQGYFQRKTDTTNYLQKLSVYCKQHYNTALGKATPEEYLRDYNRFILGLDK